MTSFETILRIGNAQQLQLWLDDHPEDLFRTDLSFGCDLGTPIHVTAFYKRSDLLEYLIQKGSSHLSVISKNGNSVLHTCISTNRIDIAKMLIRSAPQLLDVPDTDDQTPIHLACKFGELEWVELLLSLGSKSLNQQDAMGRTPLVYALLGRNAEMVLLLFRYGATLSHSSLASTTIALRSIIGDLREATQSVSSFEIFKILRGVWGRATGFAIDVDLSYYHDNSSIRAESPELGAVVFDPIPEKEILEIRSKIYFKLSFLERLLVCL